MFSPGDLDYLDNWVVGDSSCSDINQVAEIAFDNLIDNQSQNDSLSYFEELNPIDQCDNASLIFISKKTNEPKKEKPAKPITIKPKKQYYIRARALPPILKRDIRRDYPAILINMCNSGDMSLVSQYFQQFSLPNCQFIGHYPGAHVTNYSTFRTTMHRTGVIALVKHDIGLFPDFSLRFQDAKIIRKEGERGCQIVINVHMTGTMIYEDDWCVSSSAPMISRSTCLCAQQKQNKEEEHAAVIHRYIGNNNAADGGLEIQHCVQCRPTAAMHKRLRLIPHVIQANPRYSLHLDEHHRIHTLTIQANPEPLL